MMNPSSNKAYVTKLSFLPPHEAIHALLKVNRAQDLQSGLTPQFFQQRPDLQECLHRVRAKFDLRDPLLLGLWADSLPFNSDRSQSLERLTLSVLGLDDFRLPIYCFPKCYMHKPQTYDSIFGIVAWSMRCLLTNVLPTARHDGSIFEASDACRQRLLRGGSAIGCTAVIAEHSLKKSLMCLPGPLPIYAGYVKHAKQTARTLRPQLHGGACGNKSLLIYGFLLLLHVGFYMSLYIHIFNHKIYVTIFSS